MVGGPRQIETTENTEEQARIHTKWNPDSLRTLEWVHYCADFVLMSLFKDLKKISPGNPLLGLRGFWLRLSLT
jgi:hypothetical protein